jgi:hypothetical protein
MYRIGYLTRCMAHRLHSRIAIPQFATPINSTVRLYAERCLRKYRTPVSAMCKTHLRPTAKSGDIAGIDHAAAVNLPNRRRVRELDRPAVLRPKRSICVYVLGD